MFKKITVATLAAIALAGTAHAADLPSRKSAPIAPYVEPLKPVYVGINAGMYGSEYNSGTIGANVGYNFNQNIAGEVSYDYTFANKLYRDNHLVLGNVLIGQKFGVFKPYVLAGAGYQWFEGVSFTSVNWNHIRNNGRAVYALGVGSKIEVTPSVDIDARYRYVQGFNSNDVTKPEHRVTVGVAYKF